MIGVGEVEGTILPFRERGIGNLTIATVQAVVGKARAGSVLDEAMSRNGQPGILGSADRLIRIIFGLVLIVLAFAAGWGALGAIVSAVIGGVLVITALVRFCPLYRLIGVRTCKV